MGGEPRAVSIPRRDLQSPRRGADHFQERPMRKLRILNLLAALLCAALLCAGLDACAARADAPEGIMSRDQLNDPSIKIGVSTGSISESTVKEELPNAQLVYYDDKFLGYADVANGKIDAFVYDYLQMEKSIAAGQTGVRLLEDTMQRTVVIAAGISQVSKIPDLPARLNQFIAEIRADGTLDDMYDRWVRKGDETMPEIPAPQSPQYHLIVGTTGTVPPYSFYKGTELAGYDIELAHRFAAWLGADLEFSIFDFGAIAAAAQSGKVDCIMSDLQVSEERAKNFIFSDMLFEEKQGILVRSNEALPQLSLRERIETGFYKTFIQEDNWRMFVNGVLTTLLITALSILFGTALGFVLTLLCRNGNPIANGITRACAGVVQGMPMVVLLMVLYYIVLVSTPLSATAVAICGFTLTFGAAVFSILKMGIGTVDRGQYEAAYALGHNGLQTFFGVVLPQAIPHVLPAYQSEIVGLLKATAIVGYITVTDLTKMSDIVRSRTYEAFFPLIAITLIYFALEGLFILLVKRLRLQANPRRRSPERILKGVKTHD